MPALYEAKVHTVGGRQGTAESSDGHLKVQLALPKQLGGTGQGTNPEQLFGAGYAACFEGAMRLVARKRKIPVDRIEIDATVGLEPSSEAFGLQVALAITTTGLPQDQAEALVHQAHEVCPYSNATRNNVSVKLQVIAQA